MLAKIVLSTPIAPDAIAAALHQTGLFAPVIVSDKTDAVTALDGAHGLVVGGLNYEELLPALKVAPHCLHWIQSTASGTDRFERLGIPPGITFVRSGGVLGPAVACHALALLLALMRAIPDSITGMAERGWHHDRQRQVLRTPAGRSVLLLGYGDIGQAIAASLDTMGARLRIVASRARTESKGRRIYGIDQLDMLLPDCEVVILALPSNAGTANLLHAGRIAMLQPGSLIVNVGRGDVMDEDALIAALRSNHLGGAGLDVFHEEPVPSQSRLWECPNLIMTPHVGGMGDLTVGDRLARLITDKAVQMARGEDPDGVLPMPPFSFPQG